MLAAVLAVVITHAHALTLAPAQPVASTLAIVDGKIAYAGNDEAAARRAAGAGAEVIDVAGRTVIPGFNDALRGIMIDGAGLHAVARPMLIVCAWGFGSFALALKLFRWRA